MECPNCKTQNPEGARFCFNCGTTLQIACRNCGTGLVPGAKFCFNCGTPVVADDGRATIVRGPEGTPLIDSSQAHRPSTGASLPFSSDTLEGVDAALAGGPSSSVLRPSSLVSDPSPVVGRLEQ